MPAETEAQDNGRLAFCEPAEEQIDNPTTERFNPDAALDLPPQ